MSYYLYDLLLQICLASSLQYNLTRVTKSNLSSIDYRRLQQKSTWPEPQPSVLDHRFDCLANLATRIQVRLITVCCQKFWKWDIAIMWGGFNSSHSLCGYNWKLCQIW